jgi:S1-C subfamily serine protease
MVHPEMVQAAYLGVALAPADASLQSQLNLPEGVGLVVMGLIPQGPADAAGLKEHDVIKLLDDQIVVNPNQFEVLIRMHNPGDTIDLTVIRQAHQLHVKALLVQHQVPELSWIIGGMPALSGQGTVTLTVPNDNQTPGK